MYTAFHYQLPTPPLSFAAARWNNATLPTADKVATGYFVLFFLFVFSPPLAFLSVFPRTAGVLRAAQGTSFFPFFLSVSRFSTTRSLSLSLSLYIIKLVFIFPIFRRRPSFLHTRLFRNIRIALALPRTSSIPKMNIHLRVPFFRPFSIRRAFFSFSFPPLFFRDQVIISNERFFPSNFFDGQSSSKFPCW